MDERTVDLWEGLPPYLRQFREMEKLLEAERPEVQALVHNTLYLLDNLFIETAEDMGLKRFEKLVQIYPSPNDTIETRRKNVLAAWYSYDLYTLYNLKKRIEMLQGNQHHSISWDETDNFTLHLIVDLSQDGQIDYLYKMLEIMLPANISYTVENRIVMESTLTLNYGVEVIGTGCLFLTNDLVGTFRNNVPAYVGGDIVHTNTLFLTDEQT